MQTMTKYGHFNIDGIIGAIGWLHWNRCIPF